MKKKFLPIYISFVLILTVVLDFAITKAYQNIKKSLLNNIIIPNEIFHHTLKKNSKGGGKISNSVYTNSLGFRDFKIRDVEIKKKNKRILLLGDSFTQGIYLEYEDTYAGMITKHLEKKNIQVLNAAVKSYSPAIYLTKMKYLIEDVGLEFDELFLFIDISDTFDDLYRYKITDEGNVTEPKMTKYEKDNKVGIIKKTKIFIQNNFTIVFYISNFINDLFDPDQYTNDEKDQFRHVIDHYINLWHVDENFYELYGKKGLKLNQKYLDELKVLLDKKNIRLTIINYPWPGTIYRYKGISYYEQFWQDWSINNDVEYLNIVKKFDFVKNLNFEKRIGHIKKYFIYNDMHFNKTGSELIFNEMIPLLNKK